MSEVLQANIFFLITGIAVIVFTFLLCIALYHFIRLLASVRRVMNRIEAGSEVIAADFERMHAFLTEEGLLSRILGSIMGSPKSSPRPARPPTKQSPPSRKMAERGVHRTELKIKGE